SASEVDGLVLLTGVGTRWLLEAVVSRLGAADALARLQGVPLYCRGPKPLGPLKEFGLSPALVAPEPNTWRELLVALQSVPSLSGKRLYVQEYGAPADELMDGLRALGAQAFAVPIYAWRLPDDQAPLERGIRALISGEAQGA